MPCAAVEHEVVVRVGQRATLNCSTSEPVDWWYQQTMNAPAQQICSAGHMVNGFEQDGRYSIRRSTPKDSGLVIDNVTLQDRGVYSCKVSDEGVLRILRLNVSGKGRHILVFIVCCNMIIDDSIINSKAESSYQSA